MKDIQILDRGSKDVSEITILGDIQLSGEEGPEQPDLVRSASIRDWIKLPPEIHAS